MNPPSVLPQRRLLVFTAVIASALLSLPAVQASTLTWSGSATWSNAANWGGANNAPVNGDSLVFGAVNSSSTTLTDDIANLVVGSNGTGGIVFDLSAGSYTINRSGSTQTITLGSSGGGIAIQDLSLFAQTISVPLIYASNQTIQVGGTSGAALSSLTLSGSHTGGFSLIKTGNGLLTLSGTNSLGGLTVNAGTVSIAADSSLSAAPASPTTGWITLAGGALQTTATLTINSNRGITLGAVSGATGGMISVTTGTTTYNGIMADSNSSNSLTKTGAGTLVLGGSNTYTGSTTINQGQLTLNFAVAGAPANNIINGSSNLVMGGFSTALNNTSAGGPILFLQGNTAAATSQTFSGLTLNAGYSTIAAYNGNSTYNTTLDLGAITRAAGSTVNFNVLTGTTSGQGIITTTATNTKGILGGWATFASGTGATPLTPTDWAAVDANGKIGAYTGYTIATSGTVSSNSSANLKWDDTLVSSTISIPTSGTTYLNSLMMTTTGTRTVTGGGGTLVLGSNGGVFRSGTGTTRFVLSMSTLTAGGAPNTSGEIVFNTGGGSQYLTSITAGSKIVDNGTGAVSVVKTGVQSLTLSASNTYSGGTVINQGNVNALANSCFGTGAVTVLNGAQINMNAYTFPNSFNIAGGTTTSGVLAGTGFTIQGSVTLLGDTVITSANSLNLNTFNGQISGNYNLRFATGTALLTNTSNNFGGNLYIESTGTTSTYSTTVKAGASNVLPNGAGTGNVILVGSTNAASIAKLDLNATTQNINGLVSSGGAAQTQVTNSGASAASLVIGNNAQSATFGGTIVDGSNSVSITKVGAGVQIFTGSNAYSGGTVISAGTLLANNGSGSALGSGSVAVNGGTLGGTGTIAPTGTAKISVGASGSLVPGTAGLVDALTISAANNTTPGLLTLAPGATLAFNLGTNNTASSLKLTNSFENEVSGLDGAVFKFTDLTAGALSTGLYTLIQTDNSSANPFGLTTNSLSNAFVSNLASFNNAGYALQLQVNQLAGTNNYALQLEITTLVIPEPSTWAMLIAGLGSLVLIQRRTRKY